MNLTTKDKVKYLLTTYAHLRDSDESLIATYWMNACNALGLDPNAVIAENVKKLEARYPGGSFDAFYSENRQKGDL